MDEGVNVMNAQWKAVGRYGAVVIVGLSALSLSACGSPAIATCNEFAHMAPDTGLFVSLNSDQIRALKVALDAEDYDTGAYNVTIATTEVLAYCNIYDGEANANQYSPISDAL